MRIFVVLVGLLIAAAAPTAALAHAHLDHASPLAGGTVTAAPQEVALYFTEKLEPAFSGVEVTDGNGARVDSGKAQVSGSAMRIGLKPLQPGAYHVRWHVLSVDTHKSEGNFNFQVGGH